MNKLFFSMVATFTLNGTFWFYSAVSFVAVFVLYFILPETEGRTIEEVQTFFDGNSLNGSELDEKRINQGKANDGEAHHSYGSC